ncbi:hypothetical protein BD410DRAFT_580788 [Rickenella mellea]|uniref:Uncharacterized protein n=1 Tax=Rickenella mellea TaxID=50990 RepID=A0A4Y7PP71_9AGAM|nr:hypothetical protein BD410DRAFT_580788 [Rickenella mellea]
MLKVVVASSRSPSPTNRNHPRHTRKNIVIFIIRVFSFAAIASFILRIWCSFSISAAGDSTPPPPPPPEGTGGVDVRLPITLDDRLDGMYAAPLPFVLVGPGVGVCAEGEYRRSCRFCKCCRCCSWWSRRWWWWCPSSPSPSPSPSPSSLSLKSITHRLDTVIFANVVACSLRRMYGGGGWCPIPPIPTKPFAFMVLEGVELPEVYVLPDAWPAMDPDDPVLPNPDADDEGSKSSKSAATGLSLFVPRLTGTGATAVVLPAGPPFTGVDVDVIGGVEPELDEDVDAGAPAGTVTFGNELCLYIPNPGMPSTSLSLSFVVPPPLALRLSTSIASSPRLTDRRGSGCADVAVAVAAGLKEDDVGDVVEEEVEAVGNGIPNATPPETMPSLDFPLPGLTTAPEPGSGSGREGESGGGWNDPGNTPPNEVIGEYGGCGTAGVGCVEEGMNGGGGRYPADEGPAGIGIPTPDPILFKKSSTASVATGVTSDISLAELDLLSIARARACVSIVGVVAVVDDDGAALLEFAPDYEATASSSSLISPSSLTSPSSTSIASSPLPSAGGDGV